MFVFGPDGGKPKPLRQCVDLVVEPGRHDLVVCLKVKKSNMNGNFIYCYIRCCIEELELPNLNDSLISDSSHLVSFLLLFELTQKYCVLKK